MNLPGGAPQGCFLAAILFIVKFNGALIRPKVQRPRLSLLKPSDISLKYFDDATTAVSVRLDTLLQSDPVKRQMPLSYIERYEKKLHKKDNLLQQQLNNVEEFSMKNGMKINKLKTKQ